MTIKKISFVIPTYNEEHRIITCLKSIRKQQYPTKSIEIIVVDGGSQDRTKKIAKSFDARVIENKLRLAEPGVYLGTQHASGDFITVMAADNVLPHTQWINRMIIPFQDPSVEATFTRIVNDPKDNMFSKYFNSLHADPFNAFVYGKACNPNKFIEYYPIIERRTGYIVFNFSHRPPLVAMAQGFTIRKSLKRNRMTQYDDIEPIYQLIKDNKKIAYVPSAGIYHHSFTGFANFLKKYEGRTLNAMRYGFMKRSKNLPFTYKVRQYLWFPYSFSFIFPLLESLIHIIRGEKIFYLYHPFACFGLSCVIIKALFTQFKKQNDQYWHSWNWILGA